MKAVVKTITNDSYTLTGSVVESLRQYFSGQGNGPRASVPIGWVSVDNNAINFNHVVHVQFVEEGAAN